MSRLVACLAVPALIVGLAGCGGSGGPPRGTSGASSPASRPESVAQASREGSSAPAGGLTSTPTSKHILFASRLPNSDGDADNPRDTDGNGDVDPGIDRDDDSRTRASFDYPDGDEQFNFDYGRPANPSERRALAGILTRYYEAARSKDTATACAILLPSVAATVTADASSRSTRPPAETCESALSKAFARFRSRLKGAIEVERVRVDGHRAEVVFGSTAMPPSYTFFTRYGSMWRLEGPFAPVLP